MLSMRDNISQSLEALKAHKLRAALTVLGLTMGVATLITVMTLVQGANLYVEKKIANLGTDVFQVARTPFVMTDFDLVIKSLKFKHIEMEDYQAIAQECQDCNSVGASGAFTGRVSFQNTSLDDVNILGHSANMTDIDTRTVEHGRYFSNVEDEHGANVCLIGSNIAEQFFAGQDPIGKLIRVASWEFRVIGTFEKIGSVLGQDQDSFVVLPLSEFLKIHGSRSSLTVNVKALGTQKFQNAQDQIRMMLRARRHITGSEQETFFFGTKETYMSLWQSISGAFFGVFIMVSSISAIVGGIVIMNVMLVSVTERTKEIGVRRAMGATQSDILRQFLTESVMQCIIGGAVGVLAGFVLALALRTFTAFPASVQTWVAILGVVLSSVIGLFFGIYPATRAAKLDPVVALRSD